MNTYPIGSNTKLAATYSGTALGIGRRCEGLGPMPVGAPFFFFMVEVYIEIFGFLREYIAKFTERPQTLTL